MTTAPAAAAATTAGMVRAGVFHYGRIALNGYTAVRAVTAALAATPTERVLDFACGCGWFCTAVPGRYLGIDLDPDYIAFARWRWGSERREFALQPLQALSSTDRFDKGIMASALHHLSDRLADEILGHLARRITTSLVVLELDPDQPTRLQKFLMDNDRGEHIRPPRAQRAILERHFHVRDERKFSNVTRTVPHVLFVCEPRR